MSNGKTVFRRLQASGLCLALASGLLTGFLMGAAPALAAKKPVSLPLQKLDKNAPPALNHTPDSKLTPVSALQQKTQVTEPEPEPEMELEQAATPTKGTHGKPDDAMTSASSLQEEGLKPVSFSKKNGKDLKPLAYTPLEAIAVFPVVKHGHEKAFGDIPLMVSREFALKMERKAPDTRILNPIYTVEEIRLRGLGHIYDKLMAFYLKTGRPEPLALDYLLGQLSADGRRVSRVIFVEADIDLGHAGEPSSFGERFKAAMTDSVPKFMKYHVEGRVQVFDAEEPDCPLVWSFNRSKALKVNEIINVTPSVYQDSDSQHAFAQLSRDLSRDVLYVMPKQAYMHPEYDLSVQGQVVAAPEAPAPLTDKTRDAIERILGRD